MKNLFLIDGLAGTGKSDCLEFVKEEYSSTEGFVTCLRKYSTRKKRKIEDNESFQLDLDFVEEDEFEKLKQPRDNDYFYNYEYSKKSYGFFKSVLDKAIENYQNTFVIIRNIELIKTLMAEYKHINVIPVFTYSDLNYIEERLRRDGYDEEQIQFRIDRSKKPLEDYLSQSVFIYKEVLINTSNKTDFKRIIKCLIDKYNQQDNKSIITSDGKKYEIIKPLRGYIDQISNKLKATRYDKNVFLMMKYRESNSDIENLIKAALGSFGFNCICAKDPSWNITNDYYNTMAVIYCCKYGIALFDKMEVEQVYNPNVAYELGFMQSQDKKCLTIKHKDVVKSKFFDSLKDLIKEYNVDSEIMAIITEWVKEITG